MSVAPSVFYPAAAELPPNIDLDTIYAELAVDHVAAPAKANDQLVRVVEQAQAKNVELSIVVVDANPVHDSLLRDLATTVGKHEGGTVLVLSPDWAGTYSDSVSRAKLEKGEDSAKYKGGDAVVAAESFLRDATAPGPPWTAMTCVVLAGTVVAVAGLYAVKARRAKAEMRRRAELGDS